MIYSYSISKEFFLDLNNEYTNFDDLTHIINFIQEHFIDKDNFYFITNENFADKKLYQGYNGSQIKTIIQKLMNRSISNANIKNPDFFIYNTKNSKSNIRSVSSEEIKHASSELKKELTQLSPRKIKIEKNSYFEKKLEEQLKRVLLFANTAILIDRHVPRTICQKRHTHIRTATETFKIIKKNSKIPLEFLGSLMKLAKLKTDNDVHKNATEETVKVDIENFFKNCLKNSKITIKDASSTDGFSTWKFLYDYRGFYLKINDIHYSFVDCRPGFSFNSNKGAPVKLELLDVDETNALTSNWVNKVNKTTNFQTFST